MAITSEMLPGISPRQFEDRKLMSPEAILFACGWLTANDMRDPLLRIETLARFHIVSRVTAPDGRIAVVKYPATASPSSVRNLSRELFVYRVASWKPAIAAILPRPILVDEARQVLVVEFLGSASTDWPAQAICFPIAEPTVATALARAMAEWHAETKDISLKPSLAEGILFLPDELTNAIADRSPFSRRFMISVAKDRALSSLLREARIFYRHDCLIHGDIRADNWLLWSDLDGRRMKVLDWEMSGSGDPVWDIASAIAECALQGIRENLDWEPGDHGWPKIVEAMAPNFLHAYLAAGGMAIEGRRAVLFTAARLLHIASEWVDAQSDFDDDAAVAPILQIVRCLWQRPERAAVRFAQWTT